MNLTPQPTTAICLSTRTTTQADFGLDQELDPWTAELWAALAQRICGAHAVYCTWATHQPELMMAR